MDIVTDSLDTVYTFESATGYSTDAIRVYVSDSNYVDTHARLLEVEVAKINAVGTFTNPTAEAGGNYSVTPGNSVTFESAGSQDIDSILLNNTNGIASVAWDLDNDGSYDDATGSSANLTHSQIASIAGYSETGKIISVQVTDNEGVTSTDTSIVKVFSDPEVNATAMYTTLKCNQTLYLNGSGSDADGGGITSYAWDIDGDGQYDDATTSSPEIDYATLANLGLTYGNSYTISMRGIDNDGTYAGQDIDSFTLTMDTSFNIASQATVTADSTYWDWNAANVVDGSFDYTDEGTWVSEGTEPHWIKLEWDAEVLFDEVKLYNIPYYNPAWAPTYTTADFLIQIWDEATFSWITVDTVVDNTESVYTFESVSVLETDALRIYITDSNYDDTHARFLEIEVGNYGGTQQIPEPVTMISLAVGGVFCLRRRKK